MNAQGFVRLNPEFTITGWRAEQLYGYRPQETVGRAGQSVLPALIGERADRIAILQDVGAWSGLECHRHKNGRLMLVHYTVRALRRRGQLAGYLALHELLAQGDYKSLTSWRRFLQIAATLPGRAGHPGHAGGSNSGTPVAGWPIMITVDDVHQTIATNIELARRLAAVSQPELSRRTGIHEKEISRYENGRRHPGHERLIKIAAATGQTVGWFYDPHDQNGGPA